MSELGRWNCLECGANNSTYDIVCPNCNEPPRPHQTVIPKGKFYDPSTAPHYKRLDPEPIDVIEQWGLSFNAGSAVQYISRAGHKMGEPAEKDLSKAVWYLEREIKRLIKQKGKNVSNDLSLRPHDDTQS